MPDPDSTRETKRDQLIEAAHSMLQTDGVMRELGKLCLAMLDPPSDVQAAMDRLRELQTTRKYPGTDAGRRLDLAEVASWILAQTGDAT